MPSFVEIPLAVSDISEVKILTYAHGFHGNGGHFENYKT
jgi:hypothetical protein